MAHSDRDLYVVIEAPNAPKNASKDVLESVGLRGFSTNKTIYLVLVDDPTVKENKRAYVTHRVDYEGLGIKFNGYEVKYGSRNKIKTHKDAYDNAIDVEDPVEIYYPGHRVISVKNVLYVPSSKK